MVSLSDDTQADIIEIFNPAFKCLDDLSTRLCLFLRLIWYLCFRFDALTDLEAFMRTASLIFFMYFCIKISIGVQGEVG